MSYFKTIMHQILPQIPLGQLTALPDPLAGFKGPSKGREGMKDGRKGKGGEGRGG